MSRGILVGRAVACTVMALVGIGLGADRVSAQRASGSPLASASAAMCGTTTTAPKYKHVVVIFMENNSYQTIMGSTSTPYIHRLSNLCGLATNYHNVTHPSLPNYLAATDGGSLAQVTTPFVNDCTPSPGCESGSNNIFHQLNVRARRWKGYAESMPSNCGMSNSGFYAPRHNPAVYYTDLSNCSSHDVPLGTSSSSPLLRDFSSETSAPAFAWITPNLCDDMHGAAGCPSNLLLTGDNWLKTWLPKLASSAVYRKHDTVVFIAWDEGEPGSGGENCVANTSDQGCHVVALVVAPSVKPGRRVRALLSHYSLLKTSEDLLGLSELGQAKTAPDMAKPFNL